MKKLRHKEVKNIVLGHAANKWQNKDLNPGGLAPESMLYNNYKILASSYFKGCPVALKRRKHWLVVAGAEAESLRWSGFKAPVPSPIASLDSQAGLSLWVSA